MTNAYSKTRAKWIEKEPGIWETTIVEKVVFDGWTVENTYECKILQRDLYFHAHISLRDNSNRFQSAASICKSLTQAKSWIKRTISDG